MDVRRGMIEDAVKKYQMKTVDEIGDITEAGLNCGACLDELQKILDSVNK
jgi:NAD(P)H-nitrite reductase large subunit